MDQIYSSRALKSLLAFLSICSKGQILAQWKWKHQEMLGTMQNLDEAAQIKAVKNLSQRDVS